MSSWRVAVLVLVSACEVSAVETLEQEAKLEVIHVDDDAASGGNGTAAHPFTSVHEAVAAAAATHVRVIKIEPGRYEISSTLVIDSSLELRGSQEMLLDVNGWPTGAAPGTETTLVATAELGANTLVSVGGPDGPVLADVTVRDLTLASGSGDALRILKTQGFLVSGTVVRGTGIGLFTNSSSGTIVGNYMAGVGACGACISAGSAASPSVIEFVGNRSIANGAGGLLVNGGGPNVPDIDADHLDIEVRGNDLSDNVGAQPGFGLRFFVIRRDNGNPGDGQSQGHIRAVVLGNRMHGNRVAFSIDAGFPFREYSPSPGAPLRCDTRVYAGTFDITLQGNTVENSLLTPALITFSRINVPLNPTQLKFWQYLHGATFTIDDRENSIAGYVLDHPATDPYLGVVCAADATHESLDNTFVYNGVVTPPTP